ncbi:aldehyde dehydrogenase family protein [Actinotignum sp. GS-2025b]|uniref:aldehyde dehydrogenase family protein n=1 Tax=Actinotignum sp. GS-2025b TaxID=3427275 RepID=UPI003F48EA10|nr:aldehyde dehydrogenase family protein [Actinotignum schaalii]
MSYRSTNPYTGEVLAEFPYATDDEVDKALELAHETFQTWSRTSIAERAAILRRAADIAEERASELGALATLEMGKLIGEATGEAGGTVPTMLRWLADEAENILAPRPVSSTAAPFEGYIDYRPEGVVVEIEPWNFPYYQAIRGFAPAMLCGNTVILKHASILPQCAAAIVQVLYDAGLPRGVWQNLYATHAQVERLISDNRVRIVTLTGSEAAGAKIAQLASRHLKKSVMELGGSDPFIILDDADIEATIQLAIMGRCFNAGQVCASPKRMIVPDALYDRFVTGLKESTAQLRPGNPAAEETTVPPMSSREQAATVNDQIRRAIEGGASATPLGHIVPEGDTWVQPTLLENVERDNPVFHEEIFGPVWSVYRVSSEEEAIRLANDSCYGLGGTVHSVDVAHAARVAARVDTGTVAINSPVPAVPAGMPFGGVKRSGFGREMGYEGVREFANIQSILLPEGISAAEFLSSLSGKE